MVTKASEVLLPAGTVKLSKLWTASGQPVEVGLRFLDEEKLMQLTGAAPGYRPKLGAMDHQAALNAMRKHMLPLIVAGTYLLDNDGNEIPAFTLSEEERQHPQSILISALTLADKMEIATGIMVIGGHMGGAAERIRFRYGVGRRDGNGSGPVDAGDGGGEVPARTDGLQGEREPDAPEGDNAG